MSIDAQECHAIKTSDTETSLIYKMAPSIADAPPAEIVVPVKKDPEDLETKPRVRRVIEEEGGKTTASVRLDCPVTLSWTENF